MKEADLIIDIGPGAKTRNEIVAKNKPEKLNSNNSLTGKYLAHKHIKRTSKNIIKNTIKIKKASGNNLKDVGKFST